MTHPNYVQNRFDGEKALAKRYLEEWSALSKGAMKFTDVEHTAGIVVEAEQMRNLYPLRERLFGDKAIRAYNREVRPDHKPFWVHPLYVVTTMAMDSAVSLASGYKPEDGDAVGIITSWDSVLVAQLVDARAQLVAGSRGTWKVIGSAETGVFTLVEKGDFEGIRFDHILRSFHLMLANDPRRTMSISSGMRMEHRLSLSFRLDVEGEHYMSGMAIFNKEDALWSIHT